MPGLVLIVHLCHPRCPCLHSHPQAQDRAGQVVLTSQVSRENHRQLRASLPSLSRVNIFS